MPVLGSVTVTLRHLRRLDPLYAALAGKSFAMVIEPCLRVYWSSNAQRSFREEKRQLSPSPSRYLPRVAERLGSIDRPLMAGLNNRLELFTGWDASTRDTVEAGVGETLDSILTLARLATCEAAPLIVSRPVATT